MLSGCSLFVTKGLQLALGKGPVRHHEDGFQGAVGTHSGLESRAREGAPRKHVLLERLQRTGFKDEGAQGWPAATWAPLRHPVQRPNLRPAFLGEQ